MNPQHTRVRAHTLTHTDKEKRKQNTHTHTHSYKETDNWPVDNNGKVSERYFTDDEHEPHHYTTIIGVLFSLNCLVIDENLSRLVVKPFNE